MRGRGAGFVVAGFVLGVALVPWETGAFSRTGMFSTTGAFSKAGTVTRPPATPPSQSGAEAGLDLELPEGFTGRLVYRYRGETDEVDACCPNGIAFGNGGGFGEDVFVSEAGRAWPGVGILRLTDLDGDGDFLDPGEGDLLVPSSRSGVPPLHLTVSPGGGFGNAMYLSDDRFNRVWRLVDRRGSLQLEPFVTSGFFTPTFLLFLEETEQLLVFDAWNFTAYGATGDARIFALTPDGSTSIWADSRNTPRGLWDINTAAVRSADGEVVFINHGIRLDGDRLDGELLGARDANGDGDATDVGEIRYLGESPGATAMIFDTAGVLYAGRVGRIDAFEDLDGDGDFWNHEADAWDAGEQRVWADGFPGRIYELEFGPDGDLWVGFAIDATQEAGIARIAGPWPD